MADGHSYSRGWPRQPATAMALAAICCPWPQPQPWPQTATAVAPADSHSHERQTATRLVKSSERRALDDDHVVADDRALERPGDDDVGDVRCAMWSAVAVALACVARGPSHRRSPWG